MKLIPRLTAVSVLVGLAFPWTTLAATPQMALNAALLRMADQKTGQIDMSASIQTEERPLTAAGQKSKADIAFNVRMRTEAGQNGKPESEGSFKLNRLVVEASRPGESITLDGPFGLEWANKDNMAYLRLNSLPQALVNYTQDSGVDIRILEGAWIGFETDRTILDELGLENLLSSNAFAKQAAQDKALLTRYPPIQVTRVERRWKTADGDSMLRLRARINPRLITAMYSRDLAKINADYRAKKVTAAQRTSKITDLNKQLVDTRRIVSGVGLAIHLNETDIRIERIEIGGSFNQPKQTCKWNETLKRSVCTNTSNLNARFSIGISIRPASGEVIQHPAYWRPWKDIMELLEPARTPAPAEPMIDNGIQTEDDWTQTITAP